LWLAKGKAMSEEMPGDTFKLLGTVKGTVLDCGPGSGEMTKKFNPEQINAIYGAEPALDLHAGLTANAEKAGFGGGKYKALACGVEPESLIPALAKEGLLTNERPETGIFDEIVCVRVLCGVPKQEETVEGLYRLLKPGGRLLISEHVINPFPHAGSIVGRAMQIILMFVGWKFLMAGCSLNRDTMGALERAAKPHGGWKSKNVRYVNGWATVPFIVGTLTKKG